MTADASDCGEVNPGPRAPGVEVMWVPVMACAG